MVVAWLVVTVTLALGEKITFIQTTTTGKNCQNWTLNALIQKEHQQLSEISEPSQVGDEKFNIHIDRLPSFQCSKIRNVRAESRPPGEETEWETEEEKEK